MKKIFTKVTMLIAIIAISTSLMAQTYSGGSGTNAVPYQIANKADLKYLSEHSGEWAKHFVQTADIEFVTSDFQSGGDFYNSGYGFIPIGNINNVFSGNYDGDNYTIDGVYINRSSTTRVGFFGRTAGPGIITNLGLTNVNITGENTGGLAGHCYGNVSNCYTTGTVSGSASVGGLCGLIQGNTISNCYSTVDVTSSGYNTGGLVGGANGSINNCYSSGDVTGLNSTGGLVGNASNNINNSYSIGNVTGSGSAGGFVGGINDAITISDCYSFGNVSRTSGSSNTTIGGFCGSNYDDMWGMGSGTIDNCYSIGNVIYIDGTNPTDKGFCGNDEGTFNDNFFDSEASNQNSGNGATAKSNTQMTTQSTFTNWDFTGTTCGTDYNWEINSSDNEGYPHLCWQIFPVTEYYYRSSNDGDWSDASNWQQSTDESSWEAATEAPTAENSLGITLMNDINVDIDLTVDQMTCSTESELTIPSGKTLTVADGEGTDFAINGTLDMDGGTLTVNGSIEYGTLSLLEYSDASLAQTTTSNELPVSGCVDININNPNGVTLHATTSILGDLTVASGSFTTSNKNFTTEGNTDINGTLSISTGVFDANGAFDATGGNVTFTGAGNLNLGETVTSLGTFTKSNSTVTYDGADQTIVVTDYNVLALSGTSSTKTFADGITKIEGQIEVSDAITLTGSSADAVTVQVTNPGITTSRVLNIDASGKTLYINNLTIKGGDISGVSFPNNSGGGVNLKAGTVNINNVTISGSKAAKGGGIYFSSNATCSITNSTINNSVATENGGGVYSESFSATIKNSTIFGNTAHLSGGGIYCLFFMNILNSTITENITDYNNSGNYGGGIRLSGGGTLEVKNSILVNNYRGSSATTGDDYYYEDYPPYATPTLNDNGYNIVEFQSGNTSGNNKTFTATTNILYNTKADGTTSYSNWNKNNSDIGSSLNISTSLSDNNTINGTQTLALLSGSFAIDAGTNSDAPTTDQRGATRFGTTDIGAYEYDGVFSIEWNGSVSTDWNTSTNWNAGLVPRLIDDAIIADVANQPVVASGVGANCNNLTINSEAILTVNSGGSLITNGTITNNGTIDIKREISDDQWHLISSPNSVATANVFSGDYLQTWNESTATWSDITEPTSALNPLQGYSLWGVAKATTHTFSGTPNTGAQTIAISYTAVAGEGNDGANLLGNPYPSSIDWSGLDDTWGAVYYWNGTQYATWNNGSAINGGTQYIPPMQGFFIVAGSSGTFELTNENRTHEGASAYFKSNENMVANSLLLEASSGEKSDELFIRINPNSSESFELKEDAYKMLSSTVGLPQLYSFSDDNALSIDVRPETDIIQLGFQNDLAGEYSIGIKDFSDITLAILEDTKLNILHNLMEKDYSFEWSLNDDEKRFKLHLETNDIATVSEYFFNIYANNNMLYVKTDKTVENGLIKVVDMFGRVVLEQEIKNSDNIQIATNLATGIYVVVVEDGEKVGSEKVLIK